MSHTIVNPDGLHDPTPFGYSHSASVPGTSELVFVSGQYGSDTEGAVVAGGFAEQVDRAFANLGVVLAAHGLDLTHVVQLRSYVVAPDFEKLGTIGQAVGRGLGGDVPPPAQTVIGVAALATPDIQYEVDAVAARPIQPRPIQT